MGIKMKKLSLILLLFVFAGSSSAQLRTYDWNTPKRVIMKNEQKPVAKQDNQLIYKATIKGRDVLKKHVFIDNRLARAIILFKEPYENHNNYIKDFKWVNRQLNNKYGTPEDANSRIVINASQAENTSLTESDKLAAGAIGFESNWNQSNTHINHTLRGNGYEIIHVIVWTSLDFESMKKQLVDGY